MSDPRTDHGQKLGNGSAPVRRTDHSPVRARSPSPARAAAPARRDNEVACPYLRALIKRQTRELPRIVDELESRGRKVTHWAWWAFPTDLCGASEPPPETKVSSPAAAAELLARGPVDRWRRVLELVCDLSERRGELVCPGIDHGRIAFFVAFWERLDCTPDWLRALLTRLEALLPPRARAQLDKARNPPPRRAQRSIWDGGFAVKKKTANGGVRRLGNGRSGAAPAAAARPPAARRTFTETGDAPAAAARAPAPRRTFTETGDDLAFFLEAGRQREARAAARSPS